MRCAYHSGYFVPLPPSHPFPMAKYPLLHERLLRAGVLRQHDLLEPGGDRQDRLAGAGATVESDHRDVGVEQQLKEFFSGDRECFVEALAEFGADL